jgi:ankyrin repeat protein
MSTKSAKFDLFAAVKKGETEIQTVISNYDAHDMEMELIDDMNQTDNKGNTPFMLAIQHGTINLKNIGTFIESSEDLNDTNNDGDTVFMLLEKSEINPALKKKLIIKLRNNLAGKHKKKSSTKKRKSSTKKRRSSRKR